MALSAATKKIRRALSLTPGISHTPPVLVRQGRGSEATMTVFSPGISRTPPILMRPFFAFGQKSLFIPGCAKGAIL